MRSVLCFGDSNTHGLIPGTIERHGPDFRWPGVLRNTLENEWIVIEEGHSGRTTVNDDPVEGLHKNGRKYLRPCLESHAPLDLIIIMLGTNDLKIRFNKPPSEVAMGIGCLIHDIKELAPGPGDKIPEIMIVSPPPILEEDLKEWSSVFSGAPEKSRKLALEYEVLADSLEVHFFDAGSVVSSSKVDSFHLDAEAHRILGEALAQEVKNIGWVKDEN